MAAVQTVVIALPRPSSTVAQCLDLDSRAPKNHDWMKGFQQFLLEKGFANEPLEKSFRHFLQNATAEEPSEQ